MSSTLALADGHITRGQFKEAAAELGKIRIGHQGTVEALRLWARLHAGQRHWSNVDVVCRTLRQEFPADAFGFTQGAESLHQQGRTREAVLMLKQHQEGLANDPAVLYTLARYECALDNLLSASLLLGTAFTRDITLRERAFSDSELSKVWANLQEPGESAYSEPVATAS